MKQTHLLNLILCSVIFCSCSSSTKTSSEAEKTVTTVDANLTKEEAEARANAVSEVGYRLAVQLNEDRDFFDGRVLISFNLKNFESGLFLNFRDGGTIQSVKINGKVVPTDYRTHRISLPTRGLRAGANQVEIAYQQKYSQNGRGLHRFRDPEDGGLYHHTQFEAFDAHQMFPCFDQPDLKARMNMTVTARADWEVITTTLEAKKETQGKNLVWTFPETPKISTYLFSLIAGPFQKWESRAGAIPLRLFARRSLAKFVIPEDWFTPTKQGLKFFGESFAFPYPFKKYDQLIVPEFNSGAMENVAAVTFTERFVNRGKTTHDDRMSLTNIILHEMAHMWFGDLVTMQWWNGLWLNESFATYMSHLSSANATEFKDAWLTFYARDKSRSYVDDQLVTTHPVEGRVPDTLSAFANFDSITYGKGASLLKQLSFYLGGSVFRDGVRHYFKTHAYTNTRIDDFIGALEHVSKKDLKPWARAWFETAGLDTLRAEYECDARGRIAKFALNVSAPESGDASREHRTRVALFSGKSGSIRPSKVVDVRYKVGVTQVPSLIGSGCPEMVDPNHEDQDYVKTRIDSRSLEFVKTRVNDLQSAFTRIRIWPSLYEMVRDGELKPQDYLNAFRLSFPKESSTLVARAMTSPLEGALYYLPQSTAAEKATRADFVREIEKIMWTRLEKAAAGSDWQQFIFDNFIDIVESNGAREQLLGLLQGTIQFPGLNIDVDHRWEMIVRLTSLGDARVESVLSAQKGDDKSERGVQMALAADASKPVLEVKREWIGNVVSRKDLSFARKRSVLGYILPSIQNELRASLSTAFYSDLPSVLKKTEINFATLYTRSLLPATCSRQSADRIAGFIAEHSATLPPSIIKTLKRGHQEDSRCVSIRTRAGK